jgi:hypothetical protein
MANCAFFSFSEADRSEVLLVKGRAVNPYYSNLNFRVQDLLVRWDTTDSAVIRQAISKAMYGTSRTIVFVGMDTWLSRWVPEEVAMTLEYRKPVYSIRVRNTNGRIPDYFSSAGIHVQSWSEETLQDLATR